MWIMIIGSNLAVFHLNVTAPLFVHTLFFIVPFILSGIYNIPRLNITLLCLTLVESTYLYLSYKETYFSTIQIYDLYAVFILFAYIVSISFVKALITRATWNGITKERDTMENRYTSKQNFLRLFIEHTNDAIAIFDLDDSIMEVNPAFEKMYGWSREECIGNKLPLYPEYRREDVRRRSRMVRKGESFQMLEVKDVKRDGTVMDVQLTLNPIFNEKGDVIATSLIARDISFKVEKERLTLEAEKLKVAGEMAAGVAHEIRNPMTVISSFVQMMNAERHNPYREYTAVVETELKRIDEILSEYLVLAKPSATIKSDLNLHKLISDVMILFGPEMNNRKITATVDSVAACAEVVAEEKMMKQLFINLLKNSIEAVENAGIIQVKIENQNDHFIDITITDNGVGMSEEVLNKVFEPFYTTKEAGTGLGMMISQKIINDHGGKIHIESEMDVGTSIKVTLPVVPTNSPVYA
ncbi:ATP-binding protein [Chungangia koreensis]|uniref:histidine kinase n=1 Tax=Chungangia koreensis TaxID=752657 RepID=A0ABV8X1J1_9LACT